VRSASNFLIMGLADEAWQLDQGMRPRNPECDEPLWPAEAERMRVLYGDDDVSSEEQLERETEQ